MNGACLLKTGRSLHSFDSDELPHIAYALLLESSARTEEEVEARQTVKNQISNVELEEETGMPAITQWVLPADAQP